MKLELLKKPNDEKPSPNLHAKVRLDKWLWAARFFKTRQLAADAIKSGKVQVDDIKAKPARTIQQGDKIRVRRGPYVHEVKVNLASEKRGSASVAAQLYAESAESIENRETLGQQIQTDRQSLRYNKGKPSKRDRRDLERLRRES